MKEEPKQVSPVLRTSPRRPLSRGILATDLFGEDEERRQEQKPKVAEMRVPKREVEFNAVIDDCKPSFSGSHSGEEEHENFDSVDDEEDFEDEQEEIITYDGSSVVGSRQDEMEEEDEVDRDFLDYEDAGLLMISKTEKKKKYAKKKSLPTKGSEEYRVVRNEDAKRRRSENANAHQCSYCDYSAPYPNRVKRHIKMNHIKDRWKCAFCKAAFEAHGEYRAHMAEVHPIRHMCDHCGYTAKRPSDVRAHIARNHEEGLKCTVAGCNVTMSKRKLRRHILEYHSRSIAGLCPRAEPEAAKTARCLQCSVEFRDQDHLDDHMESVHGDGVNCPYDGCLERMKLEELNEHLEQYHGDGSLLTNKSPRRAKSAVGEMEKPLVGGSLMTPSLTATTSSDEELEEDVSEPHSDHQDRRSPEPLSKIPKSEPGRGASRPLSSVAAESKKQAFLRAIDGSYVCEKCESTYASLYLLKKHMKRIHDNVYKSYINRKQQEKKFDCTFAGCDKSFRTVGALEGHINKHNNVFPYSCDHCRQRFFGRDRFAVHLQKYHQISIRHYNSLQRDIPSK